MKGFSYHPLSELLKSVGSGTSGLRSGTQENSHVQVVDVEEIQKDWLTNQRVDGQQAPSVMEDPRTGSRASSLIPDPLER